jgi:5-methylcytosine-specific restriction protein A
MRRVILDEHPMCVECLRVGKLIPATVVDHIVPHKGNLDLFYDYDNLQPLCKRCHDAKTVREDGGFGNATIRR